MHEPPRKLGGLGYWHGSTDAALAQAAFEYEGLTWADVSG
jgi:hypothetical protein